MRAKVSIIVPVYNVEPYLAQCVGSLRNQTVKEIEIILIDDGSSDGCPQLCDRFAEEDRRILVRHQKNSGVSDARNHGIRMASADWIMFADPDDWLSEDAVELLYRKAVSDDYDIICGSYCENFPDRELKWIQPEKEYSAEQGRSFFIPLMFTYSAGDIIFVGPCGKLYRKSLLDNSGCRFPSDLFCGEDRIFNLYAYWYAEKICVLSDIIYYYRIRPGSACRAFSPARIENELRFNERAYAFLESVHLWERFQPHFNYYAVKSIIMFIFPAYAAGISDFKSFRRAAYLLSRLCGKPLYSQAIKSTPASSMAGRDTQLKLWLLKHRLYGLLFFARIVNHTLFQNKF